MAHRNRRIVTGLRLLANAVPGLAALMLSGQGLPGSLGVMALAELALLLARRGKRTARAVGDAYIWVVLGLSTAALAVFGLQRERDALGWAALLLAAVIHGAILLIVDSLLRDCQKEC